MSGTSLICQATKRHEATTEYWDRSITARKSRLSQTGILVVDDESLVRNFLQLFLRQEGFRVWLAEDGREAVRLYHQRRQDIRLVLLDVRMPDMDGPQTLAALRRLEPGLDCCFMTGNAGDYTHADLVQHGAARVFAKPFNLVEVRSFLWKLGTKIERRGA